MRTKQSQLNASKIHAGGRPQGPIALNMNAQSLIDETVDLLRNVLRNDRQCEDQGYEPEIEDLRVLVKQIGAQQIKPNQICTRLRGIIRRFEVTLEQDRRDDADTVAAIENSIAAFEYLRKRNAEIEGIDLEAESPS